jgi:cell division protein ZapA
LTTPETVQIRILDKEYQVQCPPEELAALQQSAVVLDKRMREIRKAGSVIGLERTAVMAALNLSYDLLQAESLATSSEAGQKSLSRIDGKLSKALQGLKKPA